MPPKTKKMPKSAATAIAANKEAESAASAAKVQSWLSASLQKQLRRALPVVRPLVIGLLLANSLDYITKLFGLELDVTARMSAMVIGYIALNSLAVRILPHWLTYEGPDPAFLEKPIPKIDGLKLLKGKRVTVGEEHPEGKKVVTVVEFWATYSHKDVNFASISFEDKPEIFKEFLVHLGHKIEYNLFWDSKMEAKTKLFEASASKGIPLAMILGFDNKIIWMGNPHDKKFEETLDKIAETATDRDPDAAAKDAATVQDIPSVTEGPAKVEKRVGRKATEDE
ncbi:hypothetical protein HDU97_004682 [Phlyctochytrium planicorne]|nr:hypothetical protein HDU97_004682 [Phlyctochytrium planicorne]